MTESDQAPEQRRIDRRKMLAGMGAVTAGAWAAPVIIDSVLNPAYAAGTPGAGVIERVEFDWNGTTFVETSNACGTTPTCSPSGWCTHSQGTAANLGVSVAAGATQASVTFNIAAAKPCTFSSSGGLSGGQCASSTATGTKSITLTQHDNGGGKNVSKVYLTVTC
jgi:hypothetical protein